MIRGRFRQLRRVDQGAIGKLMQAYTSLRRGVSISMGVHADKGAEDHRGASKGVSVADVAVLTEYGSASWLRSTFDGKRDELQRAMFTAAKRALKSARFGRGSGGEVERAMARVAERYAQQMRTQAGRLGLEDTGHLRESIEGRVVETARAA